MSDIPVEDNDTVGKRDANTMEPRPTSSVAECLHEIHREGGTSSLEDSLQSVVVGRDRRKSSLAVGLQGISVVATSPLVSVAEFHHKTWRERMRTFVLARWIRARRLIRRRLRYLLLLAALSLHELIEGIHFGLLGNKSSFKVLFFAVLVSQGVMVFISQRFSFHKSTLLNKIESA